MLYLSLDSNLSPQSSIFANLLLQKFIYTAKITAIYHIAKKRNKIKRDKEEIIKYPATK